VDREARLLAAVAAISPLPVPEPVFTVPEQGCLAYRKLPGRPLLDLPPGQRSVLGGSAAVRLGELLSVLHAVPVEHLAGLVDVDAQPLAAWRGEAAETDAAVAGEVPVGDRRPVEEFLEAPVSAGGWVPVCAHNALGIEHVLVDPDTGRATGVIDWGDAAIVEPAIDFGLLHRDLGPGAARGLGELPNRGQRSRDPRGASRLLCQVPPPGDLAYGVRTGQDRYLDKRLAAMSWLFPRSAP
jgi:aminoglycoside phosphotransferase (APT) family kinase protein